MIGLTLVTVVAVLGAGLRTSVESAVTDQVDAPLLARRPATACRSGAAEGDALARVARRQGGLARPRPTGARRGRGADVTGIDPATIDAFYTFDWIKGADAHRRRSSASTARS